MLLSASACSLRAGGDAHDVFPDGSENSDRVISDIVAKPAVPSLDLTSSNADDGGKPGTPEESRPHENSHGESSSEDSREAENSDYVIISYESSSFEESYYPNYGYEESYHESTEPEENRQEVTEPEENRQEVTEPEESYYGSSEPEENSEPEEFSEQSNDTSEEEVSEPIEESSQEPFEIPPEEESSMSVDSSDEDENDMMVIKPMLDSFTVSMNEDRDAEGYIVQYSKDRRFRSDDTTTVSTTEPWLSVNDLEQGEEFFVRYCTYRSIGHNKSYSEWSPTKYVKLREMTIVNGLTYIDGVLIVNKTYSLPADYGSGLSDITASAFNEMASAAAEDGISLWIISGYRSYATQKSTYNYFVNDRGVEQADRASARPGHSEHQTGLAIDVNTTSDYFANTPEAEWLSDNCYKYGFIIRYPEGKEEITGYKYEPWHIRFVGVGKAEKITKSGLTLEEYYGITSQYEEQQ